MIGFTDATADINKGFALPSFRGPYDESIGKCNGHRSGSCRRQHGGLTLVDGDIDGAMESKATTYFWPELLDCRPYH